MNSSQQILLDLEKLVYDIDQKYSLCTDVSIFLPLGLLNETIQLDVINKRYHDFPRLSKLKETFFEEINLKVKLLYEELKAIADNKDELDIDDKNKISNMFQTIVEFSDHYCKLIWAINELIEYYNYLSDEFHRTLECLDQTTSKNSELSENLSSLKNKLKQENQSSEKLKSEKATLIKDKENLKLEKIELIKEKESLTTKLLDLENAPITKVYTDAHDKYSALYDSFTKKFYISIIGIVICLALILFFKSGITNLINTPGTGSTSGIVEFWILKISLMLIGVTLASYFLKQASHYQRLSDQHHQTAVELQAYPNFMNSVPPEEAVNIRKELALKYFGREIDSTPHKDMSNLISDQMKSTTEMVKATTDAIKNLNTK